MMGYVKTTQDIYDWYMHNSNADVSLIQAFRAAMTVPTSGGSGQNNAPAQQTSSSNQNNNGDNGAESNSSSNYDNYASPLGVFKSAPDEDENVDTMSQSDTGLVVAAAVAAAASGAVLSFAAAKRYNDKEQQ